MRVCPKCKHRDSPCWRNSRFYFNVDLASLDDLKIWEPQLGTILKTEEYYEDGHFAYLLQSGGTRVLRKEIELLNKDTEGEEATAKKEKWFQIAVERHRKEALSQKNQTKLLEEK